MSQLEEYRGKPLPVHLIKQIRRLKRQGQSVRRIAYLAGVSVWTVHKYTTTFPAGYPHHEADPRDVNGKP